MCDTMVALCDSTEDGAVLFAKNSDRHPNEPHIMVRIPRRKYGKTDQLKTTYITIPQVEETYEVLLLKPSWIWGCEMGSNEFGLNIGNEAVFTREKYSPAGLFGMDIVRIALERCRTSDEAVDMIAGLISQYGQGGNYGFAGTLNYHNAFLIADRNSGWVLESSGEYWAAKKIKTIYCISNCLSIENDFDKCHPDLVKNAVDKKWCKHEKDFDYKKCYSNDSMTGMLWGEKRRLSCFALLAREKGKITIDTMKKALRSHSKELEKRPFQKASLQSVCMHSGGFLNIHTTGSYIASLKHGTCTFWVTGASTPCIAVFKPVWLVENGPLFSEEEQNTAVDYWRLREKLHRMILAGMIDLDAYYREQAGLENSFMQTVQALDFSAINKKKLAETATEAFQREALLIRKAIAGGEQSGRKPRIRGNLFFRHNWKTMNRSLEII